MAEIYDYEAGFEEGNKNAWFAKIIGTGANVLEMGCATGYVGEYLHKVLQCNVWGVEYVAAAAERAKQRGCYKDVLIGDVQDPKTFATLPRDFDFVMFGDVLEHLVSPEAALKNSMALLKPGGGLLVCVPSIAHYSMRLHVLSGRFEYTETGPRDRTHLRFFTPKTIEHLIQSEGYQIQQASGVIWLPRLFHKGPAGVRRSIEKAAQTMAPNLLRGQALVYATKPTSASK